jgi:PKD repeat protein
MKRFVVLFCLLPLQVFPQAGVSGQSSLGRLVSSQLVKLGLKKEPALAVYSREAYAKILKDLPAYRMYEEALKAGDRGKKSRGPLETDRPDLALLREYIMTFDPATGSVPSQKVFEANRKSEAIIKNQLKNNQTLTGQPWVERGPNNVGGRTRALMFDPNDATRKKVWAGGVAGGLWYNNDITSAASAWVKVNDFWSNMAVTCIASDPNNSQIFYTGTGEGWNNLDAVRGNGIWKSTDGGATWAQLVSTAVANFYYVAKIVVHPTLGVFAATRSGVFRSTDGGTTFIQVQFGNATDLEIGADNTLFSALNGSGVYSSTNGTTWTGLSTAGAGWTTTGYARVEIACAPSDANVIYALVAKSNALEAIYKSTNKGVNWSSKAEPVDVDNGIPDTDFSRGQAWYDLTVAVDPNNANTVIVGGVDLFRSTNGGDAWSHISKWSNNANLNTLSCSFVHADQHAIVFSPGSSSTAIFGNDGGVYYTSSLATASTSNVISARNKDYNVTQYYAGAINPGVGSNNMLAGAQDNGTQKYTAAGMNSTTSVTGGDGGYCFIDEDSPNTQISSYVYNQFYVTTNNWASSSNLLSDGSTGSFINPADYDSRMNILYSGYNTTRINRITGVGGGSASSQITVTGMSSNASAFKVSPYAAAGTSTVFVATQTGTVFKITNAHSAAPTITNISGNLPGGYINCIELGASENQILVTYTNYGVSSVWETTVGGGGSNWVNKDNSTLPDMPVRWALYNPNNRKQVLLATESGTWMTDDITATGAGKPTWTVSTSPQSLPNTRVDMLKYRSSDGTIMAITHGRGVFTTTDAFNSNTPPTVNFTADNTAPCVGSPVNFTDGTVNAGISPTYVWTFNGGTPASFTGQNPPSVTFGPGSWTVKLKVTNSFGADSLIRVTYINPVAPGTLPFVQDFENPAFPPSGWRITNPVTEEDTVWTRAAGVSGFGSGTGCAVLANELYAGGVDPNSFVTVPFDLTGVPYPQLTFDVAYQQFYGNPVDSLIVYYSTDCGQTYTRAGYQKGGPSLRTASGSTFPFVPNSSQWRKETVSLSTLVGQPSVLLKFERGVSPAPFLGASNYLYIDNINVSNTPLPPVADFTSNTTTVCAGDSIFFTDLSTNDPTSWSWTFGGGASPATSSDKNPRVRYTTAGTYNVTLVATNSTGSSTPVTKTSYITVNVLPSPSVNSPTICAGASANLIVTSSNGYSWSTGATTQDITVSPSSDASYRVTVTSSAGCTATASAAVTVNPVPSASAGSTSTVCPDAQVTLGGSPTGSGAGAPYTYAWSSAPSANLSSATTSNPQASSSVTTVYTVSVTNSFGCVATSSVQVNIHNVGAASITPGSNPVCGGSSTALTASAGSSYLWSTGATGATVNITPSNTSPYSLTVTDNNGCTSSSSVTITVDGPQADFSGTTVCGAVPTSFTDLSTGSPVSWEWDFTNDGITDDNTQNPGWTFGVRGAIRFG